MSFDCGVDLASSYIGGIRFASLHFSSLSQLLKAFPFLLNVGRIRIDFVFQIANGWSNE